jgi:hypothetical protein
MRAEDPSAMTPERFRELALALPGASEGSHHGHPDFRVGGNVFASLAERKGETLGTVMLTPPQQDAAVAEHAATFRPCAGAWGERGATHVVLAAAKVAPVRRALRAAWENRGAG